MKTRSRHSYRRGTVCVLAAFLMVGLLAMVAFAVDLGYIVVAKADLQRSADAAAHSAAMRYASDNSTYDVLMDVRRTARDYVAANNVLGSTASVSLNLGNADSDGDIVVGKLDFENPSGPLSFGDPSEYNAVRVRVQRADRQNGNLSLFFANVLGVDSIELEATATAAMIRQVSGFRIPDSGENVPVLPIVIKQSHWNNLLNTGGADDWTWTRDGGISAGGDGVPEIAIFPQDTTSGNFGTVNIGHSENSNALLSSQVRNGLTQSDLDYHGGELKLDGFGELNLTGDTGIDASLKDDLEAIVGLPRIIPIYSTVTGLGGNNTTYKIVNWVGIRVMFVKLTGSDQKVVIQPADVKIRGVISGGSSGTSSKVYSPAILVQ